jgi:hypothetical protein
MRASNRVQVFWNFPSERADTGRPWHFLFAPVGERSIGSWNIEHDGGSELKRKIDWEKDKPTQAFQARRNQDFGVPTEPRIFSAQLFPLLQLIPIARSVPTYSTSKFVTNAVRVAPSNQTDAPIWFRLTRCSDADSASRKSSPQIAY